MFDSEPFGQRAVRLGFVTSEQVRDALVTQQMLAQKAGLIGEILVEMGWLEPTQYIEVVHELAETEERKPHGEAQEAFVDLALGRKYVEPLHVEMARKIQSGWIRKNKLIGQVMVELGYLKPGQLDTIIATYSNGKAG